MKRPLSFFIAIIMFIAIIPFPTITASAESYSAIELDVPWFCQRQSGDCGIASISMAEAYYHGYEDNSDTVYNAVFNYNKRKNELKSTFMKDENIRNYLRDDFYNISKMVDMLDKNK